MPNSVPIELQRLEALRSKKVQVREDAINIFAKDPRWQTSDLDQQQYSQRIIEAILGVTCEVIEAERQGHTVWYNLKIDPPVSVTNLDGEPVWIAMAQIPHDYVTVIDMGFCRAT